MLGQYGRLQTLGHVEDIHLNESQPRWGEFAWVRISLDIDKPLPRDKWVSLGSLDYVWIHFRYERLPQFSYCCGLLGHGDQDCLLWIPNKEKIETEGYPYGPWLWVGGAPMRNRSRVEFNNNMQEGSSSHAAANAESHQIPSLAKSLAATKTLGPLSQMVIGVKQLTDNSKSLHNFYEHADEPFGLNPCSNGHSGGPSLLLSNEALAQTMPSVMLIP